MRFLTARRFALAACVPVLFLFSVAPGCSNESEGERCGDSFVDPNMPGTPNDDDCSSGLVCVPASTLINNGANRCCNSDPSIVNDTRCLRTGGPAPDAGSAGGASSLGAAGSPDDASTATTGGADASAAAAGAAGVDGGN
jgi:hypothetical protein